MISILHYQPLENYPPVMNLLRVLETNKDIQVNVYSTGGKNNWFVTSNSKIERYLGYSGSSLKRYSSYIIYNLGVFCQLLLQKPQKLLVYETMSIFPVWLYAKFSVEVKIYLHFHEFSSDSEINSASRYLKFLYRCQQSILQRAEWISHTNEDRLGFFQKQYPGLDPFKLHVVPNYPVKDWVPINKVSEINNGPIRIVHVGAIGLDSMFLEYFCNWLDDQKGKYTLDLISTNISNSAKGYLDKVTSQNIQIIDSASYYDLPVLLVNYDIGLVLYNGHIPNYVYNLPNKVVEYLHCGLDVWYPDSLITTTKWADDLGIRNLHFTGLTNFNAINATGFWKSEINAEKAFEKMSLSILS